MKPSGDIYLNKEAILQALAGVGVRATPLQAQLLADHAVAVLAANERINLTRIVDPADVLQLHIVDSLAFLPLVTPPTGAVLDIGSGAGYPGIPLAIMGFQVSLCESIRKKAAALEEMLAQLGLNVPVHAQRAEELAAESGAAFQTVTARAVTGQGALLELAAPLLHHGGRLITLKGTPETEELQRAAKVARVCGFEREEVAEYRLPRGESRTVLTYRKASEPLIALPRRPGMAQRSPLGD